MNINLYTNTSPQEFVTKSITAVATLTGSLRDGCSILSPRIQIEAATIPASVNYVYIPDFGRYYFAKINNIRTGLWELECEVDPLMSWATQLRQCSGILHRSESKYNTFLDDGSFRAYSTPHIITKEFPNVFANETFVLALAGGAGGAGE